MNNFSPLPAAASDSRLSSPEAMAPNSSNAALQARRQKLRRVVAWVLGGATLLMCAGLVRAVIRSHSEPVELAAVAATPQALAVAPAPLFTSNPAPAQAVVPAPSNNAPLAIAKPVTKASTSVRHTTKPNAKTTKHAAVVKSAGARH